MKFKQIAGTGNGLYALDEHGRVYLFVDVRWSPGEGGFSRTDPYWLPLSDIVGEAHSTKKEKEG